jgi:hypothetical protein
VIPHKLTLHFSIIFLALFSTNLTAQKQKTPPGGRIAVVVDERLAAVRVTPELTGKLVRRLSRGRLVAIRQARTSRPGIVFYLVNLSSRTHGWIQREAVVSARTAGDDLRLLSLIREAVDFDRIVRARIFLEHFRQSPLRAEVLLLLGEAAEQSSNKLTQEATRRVASNHEAPELSYFLNYSGLDRYNRQGVLFLFDAKSRRLHYDGAAWREILRRFPRSPQANEAKRQLEELTLSLSVAPKRSAH